MQTLLRQVVVPVLGQPDDARLRRAYVALCASMAAVAAAAGDVGNMEKGRKEGGKVRTQVEAERSERKWASGGREEGCTASDVTTRER